MHNGLHYYILCAVLYSFCVRYLADFSVSFFYLFFNSTVPVDLGTAFEFLVFAGCA